MADENIFIKQVLIGPMMNFAYILGDKSTKAAAIIDPGWEGDRLVKEAGEAGFELKYILATHTHFDHVNAAGDIAKKAGVKIFVHPFEASIFEGLDVAEVDTGDRIKIGNLDVEVLHTPGHSPGSVCYLVDGALFPGDTLFIDSIGRTDLEGGDAEKMFESLQRLKKLPDGVVVFPGHHYGPQKSSTIGEQKKTNIYMSTASLSDFLRYT